MTKHEEFLYTINDLCFSYKIGSMTVDALNKVSLNIPKKSLVCFSGPSGSGKSTMLNVLGLIEPLQQGSVFFNNRCFSELNEKDKNRIRRFDIGFVFQKFHLLPVLTAEENIEYFLTRQGVLKNERKDRVSHALNAVGLYESRKKKPMEMSGGQQQRIAIARAVAKQPSVIIADEPTASLDQQTAKDVMNLLHNLCGSQGMSVILASHDPMVHDYADLHLEVKNGGVKCY
jgi:ABC-type lipoprotein export system ATPase subunit